MALTTDSRYSQKLMDEILETTSKIKRKFPELYQLLDETPLFLSYKEKEISTQDFERYLASLNHQLEIFNARKV